MKSTDSTSLVLKEKSPFGDSILQAGQSIQKNIISNCIGTIALSVNTNKKKNLCQVLAFNIDNYLNLYPWCPAKPCTLFGATINQDQFIYCFDACDAEVEHPEEDFIKISGLCANKDLFGGKKMPPM